MMRSRKRAILSVELCKDVAARRRPSYVCVRVSAFVHTHMDTTEAKREMRMIQFDGRIECACEKCV